MPYRYFRAGTEEHHEIQSQNSWCRDWEGSRVITRRQVQNFAVCLVTAIR